MLKLLKSSKMIYTLVTKINANSPSLTWRQQNSSNNVNDTMLEILVWVDNNENEP